MQTELRRSTMEVLVGVGLVLSETLLLAFGLYTIYPVILLFWICLGLILVSELATQIISFVISKKETTWTTIICHVLQLGIFYRVVKLLLAEKKEFDADLRTIYRLRLLRALSGNLALVSALGLVILDQRGTYVTWIPFLGILAIISISVSNLTPTPFFLAFFWRFCELTFRITSLLVLTLAYQWWSCMALLLHWTAMFLWCFTHDLLRTKRRNDNLRTILVNFRSSLILCFCYVDVRTMTSTKRTAAYYVIILAENWILYAAWVLQSGLKHVAFLHVTATMAVSSVVMVVLVIVHCLIKRKKDIAKTVTPRQSHNYAKRLTPDNSAVVQHIEVHTGLTPIAECEIYEELSDSPRSEDSGNISPGSHTRLVDINAIAPQSVTSPMTVYTIAGHKFKVVDGALEGVQYSADKIPRARPLPRKPYPSDSDCPYAITEIVQGHHESRSRHQRCRSWSGRRDERSHSPEYETCGPASDSIYSSLPKIYKHRTKSRPKLPRHHHRQSSSSSGYDVTESDQSFSSPSPPQTLERDGVTSLTEIMDNLSKDSAISMTDEKLRVSATTKATARSRHPVSSSICTGVNSIFGESDFERSEYNSTISCAPDTRRTSKDRTTARTQPEPLVANVHISTPDCLQSTAV